MPADFQRLSRLLSLDAGNRAITNIGNAGTDFDANGGLTLASLLTLNVNSASAALTINQAGAGLSLSLPDATAAARGLSIGGAVLYGGATTLHSTVQNNYFDWLIGENAAATYIILAANPQINASGAGNFARFTYQGTNGQALNVKIATGTKTCNSGTGTETVANAIPAGSIVLGVTCYVSTILAGAGLTTWSVGTAADTDAWGAAQALAAGTDTDVTNFTITTVPIYAAATNLVFTAAAGQFDSGVIRWTVHYLDLTAAAS